jgi:hypothetical protein
LLGDGLLTLAAKPPRSLVGMNPEQTGYEQPDEARLPWLGLPGPPGSWRGQTSRPTCRLRALNKDASPRVVKRRSPGSSGRSDGLARRRWRLAVGARNVLGFPQTSARVLQEEMSPKMSPNTAFGFIGF